MRQEDYSFTALRQFDAAQYQLSVFEQAVHHSKLQEEVSLIAAIQGYQQAWRAWNVSGSVVLDDLKMWGHQFLSTSEKKAIQQMVLRASELYEACFGGG
jgi:hypothetical protein